MKTTRTPDGASTTVSWSLDEIQAIYDHMARSGCCPEPGTGVLFLNSDLVKGLTCAMEAFNEDIFDRGDSAQVEIVLRTAFAFMRGKDIEGAKTMWIIP